MSGIRAEEGMSILSKLTGRQHHFKILLTYRPDRGQERPFIERRMNVWMPDRSAIANDRNVKKAVCQHMIDSIPRHMRRNGTLELTEVYYLGWFKPIERRKV